jgi:DNA-binding LytR/AlgR family response regulator
MVGMSQNYSVLSHESPITKMETTARQDSAKPSHERFREPLKIAFRQMPAGPAANPIEALLPAPMPAKWKSARIAIKARGRILLIDPAEILVAEAQGNYVLLQQSKGSHMLREQISVLADKMQPYGLIRIHRSVLVNAAHVEDMAPLVTGEYLLRMKGGKEYKVTRTYKKNLQLLAATWIGSEGFLEE